MSVERIPLYELRSRRVGSFILRDSNGAQVDLVTTPRIAAEALRNILGGRDRETMAVLYLNTRHRIVGIEIVAVGCLNMISAHPKDIFRGAILASARGIILGHNHPSGDVDPSDEDKSFTAAVVRAGNIVGIEVQDHLIVSEDAHYSLREHGDL